MAKLKRTKPQSRTFLREWRQLRGLSQEELTARVGWDRSTVTRVENGTTAYTQQMLEALAIVLRCTPGAITDTDPNSAQGRLYLLLNGASDAEIERAAAVLKALQSQSA